MALKALTGVEKRVVSLTASGSTYTPNANSTDVALISNLPSAFTIANPSGTPIDEQVLQMRIRGTVAYGITWGTNYQSSGIATLPTTSVANKTVKCGFVWDATISKWVLMAVDATGY